MHRSLFTTPRSGARSLASCDAMAACSPAPAVSSSATTATCMAPASGAAPAPAAVAGAGAAGVEKAERSSSGSLWTLEHDKLFEKALTVHGEGTQGRWEKVAGMVPGKDAAEVRRHYDLLVEDVKSIAAGRIAIPSYAAAGAAAGAVDLKGRSKNGKSPGFAAAQPPGGAGIVGGSPKPPPSLKSAEQERRKGIPWSEEEHRLFLLGLSKYGKGDWRNISRNFVLSRTPTQVASHAQKYFIRLNSINKERKRTSIHDITSVANGDAMMQQQGPITGQSTVIGQPVVAIGSPMLPSPTVPMGPYATREPMPVPSSLGPAASPATKPSIHP